MGAAARLRLMLQRQKDTDKEEKEKETGEREERKNLVVDTCVAAGDRVGEAGVGKRGFGVPSSPTGGGSPEITSPRNGGVTAAQRPEVSTR